MKKMIWLSIFILPAICSARLKAIYGIFNISEDLYSNAPTNIVRAMDASVALISKHNLIDRKESFEFFGKSWGEKNNLCPGVKFANQLSIANCSGVLISKNEILTAKHCIGASMRDFCDEYRVVFNYNSSNGSVPKQEVYSCKALENIDSFYYSDSDYIVVKLARDVENHEPIEVKHEVSVTVGDELTLIGHPAGIPRKVTSKGVVRKVSDQSISSNLDAFGGNSGSPVFNSKTGDLVGILIRGAEDYTFNPAYQCLDLNHYPEFLGPGEEVARIK